MVYESQSNNLNFAVHGSRGQNPPCGTAFKFTKVTPSNSLLHKFVQLVNSWTSQKNWHKTYRCGWWLKLKLLGCWRRIGTLICRVAHLSRKRFIELMCLKRLTCGFEDITRFLTSREPFSVFNAQSMLHGDCPFSIEEVLEAFSHIRLFDVGDISYLEDKVNTTLTW